MTKELLFGIIGGLGFFLFGMRLMSEGLQKVGGDRMRRSLQLLTKNPLIGVLIGLVVTALIQSSSATTVMTIGLVNAGILDLRHAIGVVMGANIGTTLTAWLVSFMAVFKITNYALPAVGLGFLIMTAGRSRKMKMWGQTLLGFGILFVGLSLMKDAFGPLKHSPFIAEIFVHFSTYPLLGILVGALFTILLQSSSATIAVVQVLAFEGLISFDTAIPIILGDNIGTTITAQIAALGANTTARRTAWAHTLFNVIGVAYMTVFVYSGIYSRVVQAAFPGVLSTTTVMAHIALAHTLFNVANTAIFLPFIRVLEKVSVFFVKEDNLGVRAAPQYLEKHLLNTPPLALNQAAKEIVRMLDTAQAEMNTSVEYFTTRNHKLGKKVGQLEEAVDNLQKEITSYLVELSQRSLGKEEAEMIPVLIHSVNDVERVGDHAENIFELAEHTIDQKLSFSPQAHQELQRMAGIVNDMIADVKESLDRRDVTIAKRAMKKEDILNRMQIELRGSHCERLNIGTCSMLSGIVFLDFVDNLEKIGDHLSNVAVGIIHGLRWEGVSSRQDSLPHAPEPVSIE